MWCAGLVAPWHVGSQFPNQGSNPCLLHCGPTGKSLKYWFLTTITYSFVDHHQFSSVAQSCLTLCDPTGCSMPGFPVHHQLPEFTQTQVHQVGDAIQPSLTSILTSIGLTGLISLLSRGISSLLQHHSSKASVVVYSTLKD